MLTTKKLGSSALYLGDRFDIDCAPKHVVGLQTSEPNVRLGLGQARRTFIWSRNPA